MADAGSDSLVAKRLVDLRVVDLKLELEKRFLEKTGVKQALLERLKKALLDEGQDPDTFTFQVTTSSSVKILKKTESAYQENMPVCEDIGSDSSELISISYEADEKDVSLEMCQIIDEDNPEEASPQPDGEIVSIKANKCNNENSDEELSYQDDDPIKLCIDESPVKNVEDSRSSTPKPACLSKSDSDALSMESVQPSILTLELQDTLNKSCESETAQSDLPSSTEGLNKNEALRGTAEASKEVDLTVAERSQDEVLHVTIEEVKGQDIPKNGANLPDSKNSSKPEAKLEADSNAIKNAKSFNQSTSAQGNDMKVSAHNLWVSGLSSSTRATDLKNLFSKYGKVTGAKVVTNAKSPGSKCYGFVTMTSNEEASKCIQHLHRTELHGRMISVERAKADPSQVTIDKKLAQPTSDKERGNEERNKPESTSKSIQQTSTQEKTKDKADKPSNSDRKLERPTYPRSSRRKSKERDILTLEKIREERERERSRQWERMKRKEERRQQMMLQRERERQREVERMQREEAERLAREREKLRLEKQRLELDRLKAEREIVAMEREKQRREREKLEQEREERRREMQRHERGTKRPADSSSYWPENKRVALSPHSLRTQTVHHKSESSHRDSTQYYDKKREVKQNEKISSRRDIEVVVDHTKPSRKPSSPKIAWKPCSKISMSPSRHHSSRDTGLFTGDTQAWRSSSSANRSRAYDSSAYDQHWSDTRHLLSSSRTWSSTNAGTTPEGVGTGGSFLSSANIIMSSGRVHSDSSRYDGYKNLSSTRRY